MPATTPSGSRDGVVEELPGQRDRDRVAEQLGGPAGVVLGPAHGGGDFLLRFPERLAVFERDELGQFVGVFLDQAAAFCSIRPRS